jgi:IS5 family transposase
MKQLTLGAVGFERKTTRRAAFLAEMERVVPWSGLCALIEPFYPKPGNGRPPVGVEQMLRIYFRQHWFNLSDPAVEEALYGSQAMRRFAGIDLGRSRCRTRPRCAVFVTCWRGTISAAGCSTRCSGTWQQRA